MNSEAVQTPVQCRCSAFTLLLLLALIIATPVSAHQDPGYQGSPSITMAKDLYERAYYNEARAMLDALITAGTRSAEILYYRGLLEPDNTLAIDRYFIQVLNSYPSSEYADQARFRIAQWRYDSGFYLAARELFSAIAWRQGDSPLGQEARYWRGMTWIYSFGALSVDTDSVRTGLRLIKRAAQDATNPDFRGMALISVAEISLRLGDPDSTLVYAQEVLEAPYLEDHHPRALSLQADVYDARSDQEQARTLYQIVQNRYPETWEGRQARRWLFDDQERTVQARIDTMRATGTTVTEEMGEGNWTVQVGSYREMKNATDMVLHLTGDDYPAWHKSELVSGTLYVRVYVGRFPTRAEANAFGLALTAASAWVPDFVIVDLSRL
ncbi:SPOR domain-containing protein [Gemmatimonadota bacterium]